MKRTNKITIVLAGLIRQADKYLLVRDQDKPYWSFPQGKLDKGEDLVDAIKREVKEETGLDFVPNKIALPLVVRRHSLEGIRSLKFFFEGTWQGVPKASREIAEVKFFTAKEIRKLRLKTPENLQYLKPKLSYLPLSALYNFQTDK